ncbi:Hsp33 family molecular chaperone HslO [Ruminiclostridium cellulolyticum]|uniref:33 kDa chaperonin n=1 Tax=Ruminiclostridium cellulolyticum (strain ATCC 35319 / DSM 5812 / JCM 6584 / H10) TaxID=394503 RepID=HSLO_RUMCH|nr:Hsp33 family molecular chaperone HslO [Ruminiclostridium cellulolyticum]B8I894.1 RecName: Full=33 kDa chaperonin; AltName: Full=Heat shock protein 33 homolog; Short=HSP33 [Ruminiclostridium cellulolyticum H10]ACL77194.1 Hsp33 protein [Ruminiclostridium cellulolyticum H10]
MGDYIVRMTAAQGTVRAFGAMTTEMVGQAAEIHGLSPIATAALGRTMTAAGMMSKMLKGENDKLTIQLKGDGPLGGIVVVSDSKANVRGYVHNPNVYLPLNERGKLDIRTAMGYGYINVIRDMGLKEPYIGLSQLVSGEIADDLTYYFATSEQVPSTVALGVLIDATGVIGAGGFIVQMMPGAEEETVATLEKRLIGFPSVSKLISEGTTPEQILNMLLEGMEPKIVETVPCSFKCNCTRERMERNLISIGKKDLLEIFEDGKGAELQCHFCNTKYNFSHQDIENIVKENVK